MRAHQIGKFAVLAVVILSVSSCGRISNLFGNSGNRDNPVPQNQPEPRRETIWDLFDGGPDPNVTIEVNKYIWNATLDVLDFLPVQAADPFSGVIVYGYGTPPGGGRSYRATVYVQDPALDARSLRVALSSRGGAVPNATVRAVEDAILTRARQLRVADNDL